MYIEKKRFGGTRTGSSSSREGGGGRFNKEKPRTGIKRTPFKRTPRFPLPKDAKIDYKDVALLSRYVSDRGKMISRRISGVSAKDQRALRNAINKARFIGLLPIMGARRV